MERTFIIPGNFTYAQKEETQMSLSDFLREIGVPPNLSGYRYIKDAIELMLSCDDGAEHAVSKLIYPELAAKYHKTKASIEKAIRNAIEAAWMRGPERMRQTIFRNSLKDFKNRPTNTEFLATLAAYLSGWDFSMVAEGD